MEKFPSKLNLLVTSDPRYIPGYAGYCPQLKFHVGQTYGQLTSKLLTSSEGPHSSLELQNGQFPSAEREDGGRSLEMLIPGYTGFVPLRQNYFCRTYAESCKEARSEFNKKRKLRLQASAEPQPDGSNGPPDLHLKSRRLNSPLTAISYNPTPPKTPNPWKELSSPYLMEDSSPHKYFISGFTGYVPTSRFLFGCGYPVLTNKALIQFGKSRQAAQNHTPVPEETTQLPLISSTYPCHTGSLPSYTGHVPGIRFQCGQTFGKVTRDALSVLGSQRKSGRS